MIFEYVSDGWRAITSISDTPIFEPSEQESLRRDPYLRPYASITKAQLAGLLHALGEYAVRVDYNPPLPGGPTDDPRVNEAHGVLIGFHKAPWRFRRSLLSDFIFNDEERRELGGHKYIHGGEKLHKPELIHLLEMLGRYSEVANRPEQVYGPMTGRVRAIHAHNALVSFRERPFTWDEFTRSVHYVLSREK